VPGYGHFFNSFINGATLLGDCASACCAVKEQRSKAIAERSRTGEKRDGILILKLTLHKDLLIVGQAVKWLSAKRDEREIEHIQGED